MLYDHVLTMLYDHVLTMLYDHVFVWPVMCDNILAWHGPIDICDPLTRSIGSL